MATVVCSSEENEFVNLAVLDFVCAKFSLEKAKTSVVTGDSGALERLGKACKVDAAVVLATSATEGLQRALGALHGSMTGTGAAHVLLLRDEAWKGDAEAEDAAVRKAVLLAGFTLAEGQPTVSPVPRSLGAIRAATPGKALKELCSYSLAKPQWQQGAKQGLRSKLRRKKKDPAPEPVAKEEVLKAWKLGGGDDDLIDEDVLVDDIQMPAPVAAKADEGGCKPKRKACKNCSCGRREMEEAEERAAAEGASPADLANPNLTKEQVENPQSACGNCALGDAFRCESCPYKGMPRFKLGEKIELTATMLEADV
ncbi:anamorsin [Chloropicon roscoffensis]|uniref:Anamorsin homolog n=1 Tax=Chloropicon roscoffensis TaxID=1461544 RepID=A0AAX4P9E5_9CHLO|mmetsp:Transcript_412/g.1251  ORF Transcript_412/g.1251 Transcript_412/m.1251 type:complete len:312 (-) Transcript_412:579-1514(-)|eukprot:CAMPEP_0198463488 /NCGR_PEP_ID=MMETSP1456-20131121/1820_1 /TAXON_ID=1461544 ORGANISM="Unidentified sp., Strain RCC1871" /NCGR_SAMPLE_ID=MMETSP1456 /ASSEMBLY_ACC=CAM_ASM_001119 /LENGTH=311 /DNA_ID=CAMNT_0044188977 /DNA_START=67 /DNA_END=1002 /DNA_ORIENTATION=-